MPSASTIIDLVAAHPGFTYAAVFLLALSEAIPVVGAVVPGSALIIGIAALVPTGVVKFWPLMIAAILGAIAGDGFSYWLGRRYHQPILSRWPLNGYPGLIEKSEAFIHRHGGKSIFLARFTPAVRAFVPLVAGIVRMPARRFYVANILSAVAWAPAHLVPGILIGASFTLAGAAAGRLALLFVAVVVTLWVVAWTVRLSVRRGLSLLAKGEAWLWDWSRSGNTWLARNVRALVDPEQGEAKVLALWAGLVLAAAWTFFAILEDVVTGDPLVSMDAAIYRVLQDLRTPFADAVMIAFTEIGDTAVTLPVSVIVFLWLVSQRAWRTATYWAAAVGFAAALNTAIKMAIHRARPGDLAYAGASEFSFPSGHSTVNAVMYGFLAFVIVHQLRPVWRVPVFIAVAFFAALMAFSRLYLGAHWFSDVLGSLTLATAWVVVLGVAYLHHRVPPVNVGALSLVAFAAVAVVGGVNIYRRHATDTQRYAVRYEAPTIATADWWATEWQQLPSHRVDLTGEIEEPLTVQWAGTLQGLSDRLLQRGWRPPEPWTLPNALAWLATADPQKLPVIPGAQGGRLPSLTLIRVQEGEGGPASRVVLRMWAADVQVRNAIARRLWIGSVVEERMSRPFSLITLALERPNATRPREILAQAVEDGRLVQRSSYEFEGVWDGQVLLAREGE